MKTSARNQLAGTVKRIKQGAVNNEVIINLPSGHELTAIITCESCENLALKEGSPVVALIKSTGIIIATDLEHIKLSARNQLNGIISNVERGAVNSVVTIDLGNDVSITAGITMQSTEQLDLHPGQRATALFKASSVILGVLA
ncbi:MULTISPECIES: molybdopterin-binding protein [unclassified Neisseria]|uniref:TOBE domain-containing protein n=1 Tax=unclassified Neisseria TaxID=2623750 RepID=UPI00266696F2|nr:MULTISPECIES: TOBE domain-containing protein [unclassified Neisseria]MDO1509387.1 TOBE domain-containing protein [Neisseria sp. MVDL19-042950]MDO1515334.1 TOBE domain-containing protein [Neisseria sp. MVDL18-041461]MDO1562694.1 TOBE domain-containing protein [Neisseria sp. MVDL20-010259]